jgi:AraC-like DNA-binding protein
MQKTAIRERFDYIPSEREYAWGLYVAGTGRRVEPPQAHYQQPERTDSCQWSNGRVLRDYGILYITDGQGSFKNRDSQWRKVRAGDILLLFPGIWHNYLPSHETGWTERWILFNGDQPNQWFVHELISLDFPILHVGIRNELIERFDRLLEIAQTNPPFANQIQSGVTIEIMGLILKHHQNRATRFAQRILPVERALDFIRKNWRKQIDFVALAARSGVSSRHFRRLFQQATGLGPQQYLLNLRLNEAKRLLGTMPISEVSCQVGFDNPLYFSRLFKEKIGVPPSLWH